MMIGFVGTGNMGHPMVSNLLKAGNEVIAFDQSIKFLESIGIENINVNFRFQKNVTPKIQFLKVAPDRFN